MAKLINCKGLGFRVFSWKSSFTRVWDLGFSHCKVPCKGEEKRVVFQKTKLWMSHLRYTKIYRITICRNNNGLVWLHNSTKKWERIWSHNSKVGLCTGVKQGGVFFNNRAWKECVCCFKFLEESRERHEINLPWAEQCIVQLEEWLEMCQTRNSWK